MKKIIRLYVEDVSGKDINFIVDAYFSGYTIYCTGGTWNREKEKSLSIEILTDKKTDIYLAESLAIFLKKDYNQYAVIVTVQDIDYKII